MDSLELIKFARAIAELKRTQVESAVALLWFHDHFNSGVEVPVTELAAQLHELGLAAVVRNVGRLGDQLVKNGAAVRGKNRSVVRLRLSARSKLDSELLPLLKNPVVEVDDSVVPDVMVNGTRRYLEELVRQINGCYQYQFYDGCAVLARRLVETLLIDAFSKAGHDDKIRDADGNYMMLAGIVGVAKSRKYLALSRNAPEALDLVKEIGDRAAHHRTYITRKQDVDSLQVKLRTLIAELMERAEIKSVAVSIKNVS